MLAAAARLGAAAVLLALGFLLLTGAWTGPDIVAAVVSAVLAAALAAVMSARGLLANPVRVRWLGALAVAVKQVPIDFGIVVVELVRCVASGRRRRGVFVARKLDAGGADRDGTAWRGFIAWAASLSPNAYVIDVDRQAQRRLAHDLVPHRASETPA